MAVADSKNIAVGCQTVFRRPTRAGIVPVSLVEEAAWSEEVLRVERGFKAAHEGQVAKSNRSSRA